MDLVSDRLLHQRSAGVVWIEGLRGEELTGLFFSKDLGVFSTNGTLPKTNSLPLKIGHPNRKLVFQPSIFRGYVSFRECGLKRRIGFGFPA